jgi:hypothetical protein
MLCACGLTCVKLQAWRPNDNLDASRFDANDLHLGALMKLSLRLAAAMALGAAALPAMAADLPQRAPAPAPVMTYEPFDPWMIRVRAIGVLPDGNSSVSVNGGASISGLKISDAVVPEIDITYFFTKNIAVEAICCLAPHSIKASGALAGIVWKGQQGWRHAAVPADRDAAIPLHEFRRVQALYRRRRELDALLQQRCGRQAIQQPQDRRFIRRRRADRLRLHDQPQLGHQLRREAHPDAARRHVRLPTATSRSPPRSASTRGSSAPASSTASAAARAARSSRVIKTSALPFVMRPGSRRAVFFATFGYIGCRNI